MSQSRIRASSLAVFLFLGALFSGSGRVGADQRDLVALASRRFRSLTPAELRLLEYVDIDNEHRGDWAVCGTSADPKDASNDPANATSWPAQRSVRVDLIRWLIVNRAAAARVDPKGIRAVGARIVGTLDLSHLHVPFAIALIRCSLGELNLEETELPSIDLAGSYFMGFRSPDIVVHGSMELGIDNGNNGGGADGWESHCLGKVLMSGARIEGDLTLGPGRFQHLKDDPDFWEAGKKVAIDVSSSEIKGGLALCAMKADGAFIIDDSTIGKTLTATGAQFTNPGNLALSAVNLVVGNNVEMYPYGRDFEADGLVDFTTAQVQGNFVVIGAKFRGAPDHEHGFRAGGLVVRGGFVWKDVTLENDALLDLGNAHFGGLLDDEHSWPTPGKLLIDGLVYNSFGPDTPRDASSRLKWLRLQPGFHPQPYHQLASFLRDNGDEADSLKILAAKEEAEWQLSGVGPRFWGGRVLLRSPIELISLLALMLSALAIVLRRHLFKTMPVATEARVPSSAVQLAADRESLDAAAQRPDRAAGDAENSTAEGGGDSVFRSTTQEDQAAVSSQATFRREGEFWTISYEGRTIRLKDAKGLRYIAYLLSCPAEKFRVHDLVAIVEGVPAPVRRQVARFETSDDLGDAGPVLDEKAKASYRQRRQELREEADDAEEMNDPGRAERARAEIDMLEQQLSAAVGLGGRDRKTSAHSERARVVVTRNIRATVSKILEEHPPLGRHFNAAIKTGYICTYLPNPESVVTWDL